MPRTPAAPLMGTEMLHTLVWRGNRVAPGKVAAEAWWRRWRARLLPQISVVAGALALMSGGVWTVREYAAHRADLRLAETGRLLEQFRSGPVAEAWAHLRTAWLAEQARQDAMLARAPSLTGRDLAQTLYEHQLFVLETIAEYQLHDEIEVVHQYLTRLATCVRMGSCDAAAVAAQLGPALWRFRDQHRPYFQFEYPGVDLDAEVETVAPRAVGADNSGAPRW